MCITPTHIQLAKACNLAKSMEAAMYNLLQGKEGRSKKWGTIIVYHVCPLAYKYLLLSHLHLKYPPSTCKEVASKSHTQPWQKVWSLWPCEGLCFICYDIIAFEKPLLSGLDCLGGKEWAVSASIGVTWRSHFIGGELEHQPAQP